MFQSIDRNRRKNLFPRVCNLQRISVSLPPFHTFQSGTYWALDEFDERIHLPAKIKTVDSEKFIAPTVCQFEMMDRIALISKGSEPETHRKCSHTDVGIELCNGRKKHEKRCK